MTRSPLFYPLNRGMDADAGGVADLQTDVMRFMAILSLCLVAIFALVQSIPLAPKQETPAPVQETTPVAKQMPQQEPLPVAKQVPPVDDKIVLTRPQAKKPLPEEAPPVLQHPRSVAIKNAEPQPVEQEPVKRGFTLRFEDEQALTRLVARNEVGLYAILPDRSYRMNVNRGDFSFWPASMPTQFHEMDQGTVPSSVTDAFRHSSAAGSQDIKWGVTIPSQTSRQLETYLREQTGGDLVIDADGGLRLE
ncbi:MAG: hypothetical protein R3192_06465 [Woeseiaceae bacterium]|nr:hypothetical protein [Woeseiaceae bacterium]